MQETHASLVEPTNIVAFLQNPWFKPGTKPRAIELYQQDILIRRRVLSMSRTGQRLYQAFEGWFDIIWWDNANPNPTFTSDGALEPDIPHIRKIILARNPDLILTFGLKARAGVRDAVHQMFPLHEADVYLRNQVMHCHHPNARHKTQADLNDFALQVKRKELALCQ